MADGRRCRRMGHMWTTVRETWRGSALEGRFLEVRMRCMECGREAAYRLSEAKLQARIREHV
jgi:hypothetical protein